MRMIDADALIHRLLCQPPRKISINSALELVSTMPTVNAIDVVQCKDCRHFRFFDGTFGKGWMCFECNMVRNGDEYCSRGERREDEVD